MLSDLDTSSPGAVLKLFPLNVRGQAQTGAKTQHVLREKTQQCRGCGSPGAAFAPLLCCQLGLSVTQRWKCNVPNLLWTGTTLLA